MRLTKQMLTLYSWAVIGLLVVFLGRIALFFEKASGQRVGYQFLLLPALLLAAGAIWHLLHGVEFIGSAPTPAGSLRRRASQQVLAKLHSSGE